MGRARPWDAQQIIGSAGAFRNHLGRAHCFARLGGLLLTTAYLGERRTRIQHRFGQRCEE